MDINTIQDGARSTDARRPSLGWSVDLHGPTESRVVRRAGGGRPLAGLSAEPECGSAGAGASKGAHRSRRCAAEAGSRLSAASTVCIGGSDSRTAWALHRVPGVGAGIGASGIHHTCRGHWRDTPQERRARKLGVAQADSRTPCHAPPHCARFEVCGCFGQVRRHSPTCLSGCALGHLKLGARPSSERRRDWTGLGVRVGDAEALLPAEQARPFREGGPAGTPSCRLACVGRSAGPDGTRAGPVTGQAVDGRRSGPARAALAAAVRAASRASRSLARWLLQAIGVRVGRERRGACAAVLAHDSDGGATGA